jgi:hypothetical protein
MTKENQITQTQMSHLDLGIPWVLVIVFWHFH